MQVLNVPIRTSAGKLRPNSGRQLQGIPCANGCRWRLYYWFPCSMVASYLYIQSNEEHTELVEYYVPRGEQKQVTLPDGTTAYLNSGTLLVYPQKFTGDIRSVYLIEKLILT